MSKDYLDIYIYMSDKQGNLIEIPAFILKKLIKTMYLVAAYDRDNKHIICEVPREPGMIFHNVLWYRKPNFEKAKKMFLMDYINRINKEDEELRILNKKWATLDKQKEVIV